MSDEPPAHEAVVPDDRLVACTEVPRILSGEIARWAALRGAFALPWFLIPYLYLWGVFPKDFAFYPFAGALFVSIAALGEAWLARRPRLGARHWLAAWAVGVGLFLMEPGWHAYLKSILGGQSLVEATRSALKAVSGVGLYTLPVVFWAAGPVLALRARLLGRSLPRQGVVYFACWAVGMGTTSALLRFTPGPESFLWALSGAGGWVLAARWADGLTRRRWPQPLTWGEVRELLEPESEDDELDQ